MCKCDWIDAAALFCLVVTITCLSHGLQVTYDQTSMSTPAGEQCRLACCHCHVDRSLLAHCQVWSINHTRSFWAPGYTPARPCQSNYITKFSLDMAGMVLLGCIIAHDDMIVLQLPLCCLRWRECATPGPQGNVPACPLLSLPRALSRPSHTN